MLVQCVACPQDLGLRSVPSNEPRSSLFQVHCKQYSGNRRHCKHFIHIFQEAVVPKLTNQIAVVKIASEGDQVVTLEEADEYFKQVY